MCLIIVAKSGTKKYSDTILEAIRKGSTTNIDGIGYTFKRAGSKNRVWIAKGFKEVETFIKCLKNKRLKDEDELIIHLRIGNKGAKTVAMNHPFVLSNKDEEILNNDLYIEGSTMCHNGTFNDYSIYNSDFSDTFFFVKNFMSVPEIQALLRRDSELFKTTFKEILKLNKLAFIFNGETPLVTLGNFVSHSEGYLFSNDSYKGRITNVGGNDYSEYEGYEDWQGWAAERNTRRDVQTTLHIPESSRITNRQLNKICSNASSAQDALDKHNRAVERENIDNHTSEDYRSTNSRVGRVIRNSRGFIESDGKTDILPTSTTITFDRKTCRPYYPHFNSSIYINREYLRNQFEEARFAPKYFNYKHFVFQLTSLLPTTLNRGVVNQWYKIIEFDNSKINPQHELAPLLEDIDTSVGFKFGRDKDHIYVTNDQLIQHFQIKPLEVMKSIYEGVYRLMKNHDNISKTNFGTSNKIIAKAVSKEQTKGITYRTTTNLDLASLKIYNDYLGLSLFDIAKAMEYYHRVQQMDIYVN